MTIAILIRNQIAKYFANLIAILQQQELATTIATTTTITGRDATRRGSLRTVHRLSVWNYLW
jgi:hypothetical protein